MQVHVAAYICTYMSWGEEYAPSLVCFFCLSLSSFSLIKNFAAVFRKGKKLSLLNVCASPVVSRVTSVPNGGVYGGSGFRFPS